MWYVWEKRRIRLNGGCRVQVFKGRTIFFWWVQRTRRNAMESLQRTCATIARNHSDYCSFGNADMTSRTSKLRSSHLFGHFCDLYISHFKISGNSFQHFWTPSHLLPDISEPLQNTCNSCNSSNNETNQHPQRMCIRYFQLLAPGSDIDMHRYQFSFPPFIFQLI